MFYCRIIGVALGGDSNGHGIKRQLLQKLVTHFGCAAIDGVRAIGLCGCAVLAACKKCGDADVTDRCAGILLAELFGDAAEAYGMAIGLESDPAVRNFLLAKRSALPKAN